MQRYTLPSRSRSRLREFPSYMPPQAALRKRTATLEKTAMGSPKELHQENRLDMPTTSGRKHSRRFPTRSCTTRRGAPIHRHRPYRRPGIEQTARSIWVRSNRGLLPDNRKAPGDDDVVSVATKQVLQRWLNYSLSHSIISASNLSAIASRMPNRSCRLLSVGITLSGQQSVR